MDNNKLWSISLMIVGVSSIFVSVTDVGGIMLPDALKRIIGILQIVSIPVLIYTSVKKFRK